jgi:hypothetical protein
VRQKKDFWEERLEWNIYCIHSLSEMLVLYGKNCLTFFFKEYAESNQIETFLQGQL